MSINETISRSTFPNLVIYLKVHSVLNNSWSKFTVRPASAGVELVSMLMSSV